MSDTKDVTNAEAAASAVPMKILSGNIRKAAMESSLDSGNGRRCGVLRIGDTVVYVRDGARGVIMVMEGELCQVMWEDTFVSWERLELLEKVESLY